MTDQTMSEQKEKRIKCAFCDNPTGFHISDFDDSKDLDDVYCSNECQYESETGRPGEEY